MFSFARPLTPAEAEWLRDSIDDLAVATDVLSAEFAVTPSFASKPIVGAVAVDSLGVGGDDDLAPRISRLIESLATQASTGGHGPYSDYAADLLTRDRPYRVTSLIAGDEIADELRSRLNLLRVVAGWRYTELVRAILSAPESTSDSPEPEPLNLVASATHDSGTGNDPFDGWGPDFGQWYFEHQRDIVNGYGDTLGSEYEALISFGWSSHSQLRSLRSSGTDVGLEINLAYKDYQPVALGDTRSGGSAIYSGYVSDLPGAYQEFITIEDTKVTMAVGTHEAEKIRWRYQTSPNYFEDYYTILTIQDTLPYSPSAPPAHTISVDVDYDMLCGNAAADACFYKENSKNAMSNYFCAHHADHIDIRTWSYHPGNSGPWRCRS